MLPNTLRGASPARGEGCQPTAMSFVTYDALLAAASTELDRHGRRSMEALRRIRLRCQIESAQLGGPGGGAVEGAGGARAATGFPNRGVGWAEFLGPRARPRPLVRARITLLLSLIHCRRSSSLRMNSAGTSHGTPEAHAGAPRMLCSRGRSGEASKGSSLPGNGAAGLLPTSTSPPWAVRACVRVPPPPTSLRRRRG